MIVFLYILYFLILLVTIKLIIGPGLYDRLLCMTVIQSLVIIIMCFYAVIYKKGYYLDVAIVFSLLSFGEIIAINKIYKSKRDE